MTIFMILYWLSFALIVYTYAIFPLILIVRGVLFPRQHQPDAKYTPTVSMIVAAYNEEESIAEKLQNSNQLDYPADKLEVLVASDGSTDDTNEIVRQYENERIKLLALPRLGKAKALNEAVAQASGEILVFSDANSQYAPDAIRQLTKHFADDSIGGVAGNQRYLSSKESPGNAGEANYWSFDRQLKIWESRGGHAISATGAIYAIRRSLFQGVVEGVTDDFYVSTKVIAQGSRLIFEPDAVAYEYVAKTQQREFRRKVRIMTRGLTGVKLMRELLNPFKHGFYALQLATHKLLRRLLFLPLALLFISNFFLAGQHWFYVLTLLPQIAVYGLAALGWWMLRQGKTLPRLLSLPTYAVMVYVAAAFATWNVVRGNTITRWTTERTTG